MIVTYFTQCATEFWTENKETEENLIQFTVAFHTHLTVVEKSVTVNEQKVLLCESTEGMLTYLEKQLAITAESKCTLKCNVHSWAKSRDKIKTYNQSTSK